MQRSSTRTIAVLGATTAVVILAGAGAPGASRRAYPAALAEKVLFTTADKKTLLTGYLFKPDFPSNAQAPAVVMMHGRAGAYSQAAQGEYGARTLSQRHRFWGEFWRRNGYMAILVDGFGPRGYPQGFPRFSYSSRPAELDEVKMRPLDALGALIYLGSRADIAPQHVALQGWSNGASTTLATMARSTIEQEAFHELPRFRAALAFYPGCGLKDAFTNSGYAPYAPLRVFMGSADEEVSPARCDALLHDAPGVKLHFYPDATHSFDDPGRQRQQLRANALARADAIERSLAFLSEELR
ncbi:MAG: dienelactone hydrolase family protein [Xanthobacteraceae bacterium]